MNNPYDKIVSGYHQSIAQKTDASFSVWGEDLDNSGAGSVLRPLDINVTNFPNLRGTPLKAAIGGQGGGGKEQAILLTTDGLYVWGSVGYVINLDLKGSSTFGKIATNNFTANNVNTATGLPLGVNPYDVKMMTATYGNLIILTNAGEVWVLAQNAGFNATGNTTVNPKTWLKAKINASTDLTGVTAVRAQASSGTLNAVIALKSDGTVYTWGSSTYLGDGSAAAARSYATKMTLPAEFSITNIPKMIAVTGGIKNSTSVKNSYYILSNSGALYSLGYNAQKQLGDFTTTERTSWVNAKINSTTNFSNVSFITAQEHDASFPGIAAVTKSGDLYTWGDNEGLALGRTTDGTTYDPGTPLGFTSGTDVALSAELGGHTLVYLKQGSAQFCYVGHKTSGSMGDGVSASSFINTFNCTGTPSLAICGSVPVAASTTTSTITANPTSIAADGTTTSVITVQLKQANGTNLTSTGGTVLITTNKGSISSVTDNNDGTYTAILTSSTFVEAATLNYTLNGTNGTNNASVNFTAVTNPVLTATGALKTFTSCSGCTVAPQSFTVSGVDLATNNLVVTAPTGFQVSTSPTSGFATSINIAPSSGTVTTTTVYAKLTNNAISVTSDVISVASTGAVAKTITVTTNTDNALNFDGSSDYASLPSAFASAYNNSAVTIEAWIKTTDAKAINEIIGWGSSTVNNNVVEFRTSYGKLQFILNDGTKFYGLECTTPVNTGKWVHVAVVKSGSSAVLYVNGQVASVTSNGDITSNPTLDRSNIGLLAYKTSSTAYGPIAGSYFNGGIDQLRVWNTARTSSDIAANMFVEMSGNETGLVANYDFNQGVANGTNSITTVNDNSSNAYNGTLTSFALTGTSSNFVAGFIPEISAAGNATTLATGNTLQLSNGLVGGVWASSNTSFATVNSSTGLVAGVANGSVNITYTICDKTVSYALTIVTPTITTSGTLKTFTSCSGCAVAPQTFTVSAVNLGTNLVVAPPTGFEVATTLGGTYSSTLSLVPSSGTIATTTIYARLINNASTAVGGNFNITSTGATTRTVAATVNTDNALMLDHAGYVNLGDVLDNTNLANTTEAWVYWKGSSTEAFSEIFTKDVVQAIAITNGNKLHANFGNGSTWSVGLNSTTSVPLNTWTHVAVTRSSTGVVKMYINGVLDASTNTMNITGDNAAFRSIGGKRVGTGMQGLFTGAIDNLKVWNIERSDSEISNGMFTELNGDESNLLAYYNFNQGIAGGTNTSITTLTDRGPSGFNGTLTALALTGNNANFVAGPIQDITAAGNATTVLAGGTLALYNGLTGGVWSSSNNNVATINASTGLITGVAGGNATFSYTICGKVVTYNVTVLVPTLTTGTLKTFTSCSGCTIPAQNFTVSGTNLGSNVIITAPTGFEVSNASAGTYSATLSLTPTSGTLATTNVYARLINNATTASNGNFTVASTGAVSKTVTATVNTDNALNFDGVNDHVVIDNAGNNSTLSFSGTTNFTLEAWVKRENTGGLAMVISKYEGSRGANYYLGFDGDGKPLFARETFPWRATSNNILPVSEWHHIAGVYDGSAMKLYVDGVLNKSENASGSLSTSVLAKVAIGTGFTDNGLAYKYKGGVDEVRIWNRARTASEILNAYLAELQGNETGLVAYYNFNQGTVNTSNTSITTLTDRSSSAINGTITNMPLTGTSSNFVTGHISEIDGVTILIKGLTSNFTDAFAGGTWSSAATNIATVDPTTGVVTGVNPGTSTITYTICEKTVSKVVTVVVPTITKTGTLNTFTTCLGTASDAQTFTVSAQYLTANLVLTAPVGYELATSSAGTYTTTLSIAPTSGSVSARLIYVRLSTSAVNGQSGNIAITSTDAVTQNMATGNASVTRTVVASVSISSNATNNSVCSGTNVVFTATPTNGGSTPTYQWKLNGNNISGANSATYSTTSLANNDVITVVMTSSLASCVTGTPATSNAITTTVSSIPATPGSISGQSVICMNSNQVYSIAAVPGATSYNWIVNGNLTATPSSTNVINITAANTANGSGSIEVFASNACGTSIASSSLSITINSTPAPTASFTLSANTVCLTNGAVTFTSTSTPNATTSSTITTYAWAFGDGATASTASASNTYTTAGTFDPILTISDGNQCTSSFSSRITIDPVSVAGTASVANSTICEGSSTVLTLAGHTGTVQWQQSTDGINFTNISGANASSLNTGNLTITTYYQAVVTSGTCSAATSGVITVTVSPTPVVTLGQLANLYTTATSFDLTYSNAVGTPDEYSITAVGPNAMPNFVAISNYGLPVSPITVSIPASSPGIYNFNLLVTNGSLGCVSSVIPFTQTINSQSSTITVTGLTSYTYNGSTQGPATNTKTGSTGAVTYSYVGTGSTTYGPSATKPTGAGTYEVIATLAADANYSGATSVPYAFTITGANNPDTDGDGVTDAQEAIDGTDPNDVCSYQVASQTLTPTSAWLTADCDGDGTPNGTDTDPNDPCIHLAGATPVTTNAIWRAADCDGDGVTNGKETDDGTDPNEGCSYVVASRTLTPSTAWGTLDCDADGNSNATDPNIDTPVASNDLVNLPSSGALTVNILTNDDFLPGANTEISRQLPPNDGTAKGTVTFNPLTGEMTYKRAPFETGLVTMGYKVTNKAVSPPVSALAFVTILACDLQDPLADCDGDGEPNGTDLAPTDPCVYEPTRQVKANVSDDWKALDCDGDGVLNGTELADGTSPSDACSFKAGSITMAPSAAWVLLDCDADGVTNQVEGTQDLDGDGIPNCLDTDSDGDSISDKLETIVDTDRDGKPDYLDLDSDNDGILDSVENKVCTGTGILCDTDADGTPNFRDLDSDADQIKDVIEASGSDYNQDGIADGNIDEKGIPSSANKGLTPPDTDRDGKLDPYDVDSDGDGILDFDEEFNEDADFADCDKDGIVNRLDPDECEIFAPQGISPNGDGKNDRFVFKGLFLRKIPNHLSIFNRWGTLVFEMESYDNSFTGTVLPDGTYYYVLDFFGKKPTISNYLSVDRTIK
ncbi:MAG: LamG-like jellyroll fold domain-containing protein [Aquirufa antheringensis]